MQVAQKLYEAGHITYMRTDAVNLSEFAIQAAKDQIISQYGEKYSKPTHYATKSKGAQEAHECIRPAHRGYLIDSKLAAFLQFLHHLHYRFPPYRALENHQT